MTPKVHIRDLGQNDYKATWDLQEEVFKKDHTLTLKQGNK